MAVDSNIVLEIILYVILLPAVCLLILLAIYKFATEGFTLRTRHSRLQARTPSQVEEGIELQEFSNHATHPPSRA